MSLGNHEFDLGVTGVTPFIENLTCPVLAANLILTKVPELAAENNLMNSVIFDINGFKVGVIGYLTPETKILAIKNDVEYKEETVAIKEEIIKLKTLGITIFIALGHSGYAKDLEIAKNVDDIDIVIGGHTNTFLWNGSTPDSESIDGSYPTMVRQSSGRMVPVVQAYAYTKYLGKILLSFDSKGEIVHHSGNPILLNNAITQDPDVLSIISRYEQNVTKFTEIVVGNTSVMLDARLCKIGECNIGNLITDAMIFKYVKNYKGKGWTDTAIAVIQRGGIRASIAPLNLPANITQGDLLLVLPFDGNTMKITLKGSDILKMLEHSIEGYTPTKAPGAFLQFSGMKVVYDIKQTGSMRIKDVQILCSLCDTPNYQPLNKSKYYNLLTSSFLAMGGDGYSVFNDLNKSFFDYTELDSLTEYIKYHSPMYPRIEGRIIINHGRRFMPKLFLVISALISLKIVLLC